MEFGCILVSIVLIVVVARGAADALWRARAKKESAIRDEEKKRREWLASWEVERKPSSPPPIPPQAFQSAWRGFTPVGRRRPAGESLALRPSALLTLARKELRAMLRSSRSAWMLGILMLAVSVLFLAFWRNHALGATLATRSELSRMVFATLYMAQCAGLGLLSAVMAATVVTVERENRTLDLLYCTAFSRFEILLAKWFSTIVYQLILFVSLAPIIALAFQLGGVGLEDYISAILLTGAAIATCGMVGLAFSAYFRRTIPAAMAAAATVFFLGLLFPVHRLYGSWGQGGWEASSGLFWGVQFLFFLFVMAVILIVAALAAWHGLARTDSMPPIVPKPVIADPVVIRQRRTEWPYYLIDPLARNQEIRDNESPVFVKEQRTGAMARLDVLIRLGYGAIFASLVVSCVAGSSGDFRTFSVIAGWMTLLISLFVPILSATCFSREREEGTLDLLQSSLLSTRAITWAKFRVSVRFIVFLVLVSWIIPVLMQTSIAVSGRGSKWSAPTGAAIKLAPMMFAFGVLYAAVGVLVSSWCRRNLTAIVSAYAVMAGLMFAPFALGFGAEMLGAAPDSTAGGLGVLQGALLNLRETVGPVVSPFHYFLTAIESRSGDAYPAHAQWGFVLRHAGFVLLLSAMCVEAAAQIVHRHVRT